ncbi:MAG: metal ABC transporter solute-binding protein, Zn/Mn family, partial [Trichloromonadaceae bacterium]
MKTMLTALGFAVILLAPSATVWAATPQGPRVVVSIKPLHSLVAGVMQGVAEPQLLLQGGSSPHGYVLRPSEARLLNEAQLVVWVGHQLESF